MDISSQKYVHIFEHKFEPLTQNYIHNSVLIFFSLDINNDNLAFFFISAFWMGQNGQMAYNITKNHFFQTVQNYEGRDLFDCFI